MQENFILIESSLKAKIENLLKQLEDREIKLSESAEKIFKLESGLGYPISQDSDELLTKINHLEHLTRQLQDEKYELQKNIADLQEKIISTEPIIGNGAIIEKDNRIAELESVIEELKKSIQLLEEESKAELQKQILELSSHNEEMSNKISDLEKLVFDYENEKAEAALKASTSDGSKEEDKRVLKLTKELDDLNKSMIKIKVQHKNKIKTLQKQLENFKKVSDYSFYKYASILKIQFLK